MIIINPIMYKKVIPWTCGDTVIGQDGLEYGTVLAADGNCWLDRNLGAPRVATSSTDPQSYGDYYQWGRLKDGHEKSNSGTTSTRSSTDVPGHGNFITHSSSPYDWRSPQNDNLWQGVDGVNNVCPAGFRLPTSDEWSTLVSAENITDRPTAYASSLKLPAAGYRSHWSGNMNSVGSNGYYWSSTVSGTSARGPNFYASSVYPTTTNSRAYGFTVRCIEDY